MIKKIISILLCSLIMLGVTGCGNKAQTKTEESAQVATNKVKKEIKLNEPFEVKRPNGDYNFIIKSVTKTDWWERVHDNKDKTVVLLNLECENISFKNEKYNGVLLYDAFTLKDNNNYMLSKFSMGYNEVNLGYDEIPPNTKSKISIPYVIDNDATSVSVEFVHDGTIENIPITE
ncbi:DUF5067 domain-containing protein [Clostridium botulinum]|uniref:hypothetical protein n=1 Tax=Clostridium botulinum TaxID=1491 RepID=UPI0007747695|nr:hypothetical protein [Clostridium botulinum]NFH79091.1 DUF5067 domain-containing protein [Clostridium botulinum]NFH82659.1 DUF5067 domain-containing protein [Clostridium botulinum]NFI11082.1 DUF5067 domain-containing protein [Clostridium botulinum]NFI13906.1 DUF5067 domain-containing protein [Clostridium botulinum]NFO83355.1 DUF5067 domain-containing protein [Clostridium botulinum]